MTRKSCGCEKGPPISHATRTHKPRYRMRFSPPLLGRRALDLNVSFTTDFAGCTPRGGRSEWGPGWSLLTRMYGPTVLCKRFFEMGKRSCVNVSGHRTSIHGRRARDTRPFSEVRAVSSFDTSNPTYSTKVTLLFYGPLGHASVTPHHRLGKVTAGITLCINRACVPGRRGSAGCRGGGSGKPVARADR